MEIQNTFTYSPEELSSIQEQFNALRTIYRNGKLTLTKDERALLEFCDSVNMKEFLAEEFRRNPIDYSAFDCKNDYAPPQYYMGQSRIAQEITMRESINELMHTPQPTPQESDEAKLKEWLKTCPVDLQKFIK